MKEWQEFLSLLEKEMGKEIVRRWIPPLIRFDAANVYLASEDSFQISWFEEHVRPRLKHLMNQNERPIKVHLFSEKKTKEPSLEKKPYLFEPDPIDPEMTLEHLVPQGKNLIVHKLLSELSSFNPIYLYGPKGSGKTHFLMAAALDLKKKGKKVLYVKAQTFTEHVVQAIRLSQMREFRKIYREIDVLLVDDIDHLSNKSATQEEFFHTFNTLHTSGLPILLSALHAPSKLQEIEPRLVSRFEWGICLELEKTPLSTVLAKKMELWNFPLSKPVFIWLSETFIQEPILALQALVLRTKGTLPDLKTAQMLLQDFVKKEQEIRLTPEQIIKTVASYYGLTQEDLLGKSQTKTITFPRQIAMFFCREKLQLPFQKIGEIFARDHSTVISSIRLIQKKILEKSLDLDEVLKNLNTL